MMKTRATFLTLALAFGFAPNAQAQLLSYGLDGGVHVAQIQADMPSGLNFDDVTFSSTGGYHLGAYARMGMGIAYVQPNIWITELNQRVTMTQDGSATVESAELMMRRVDIPVEFGAKLGPLFGFVAPVWSANIQDYGDITQLEESMGTWGAQIGVGVKLWKLQAKVRFEGNMQPIADALEYQGQVIATDGRMYQFIGSISYRL